MRNKIQKNSFINLQNTCQALNEHAKSREVPPLHRKERVILQVCKVDGRPTLKATAFNKLKWYQRFVRRFGCGKTTLKAVSRYLSEHEPQLPPRFSELNKVATEHYLPSDLQKFSELPKKDYQTLKDQKIRGYEAFKTCLVKYNRQKKVKKVYLACTEPEKKSLEELKPIRLVNVLSTNKGWLSAQQIDAKQRKTTRQYRTPVLDPQYFLWMEPSARKIADIKNWNVLGFCHEHGLGTERSHEKARQCYQKALDEQKDGQTTAEPNYVSPLNLAGLIIKFQKLKDRDFELAMKHLETGSALLEQVIDKAKAQAPHPQGEEPGVTPDVQKYVKILKQTSYTLASVYKSRGLHVLARQALEKANE